MSFCLSYCEFDPSHVTHSPPKNIFELGGITMRITLKFGQPAELQLFPYAAVSDSQE